MTGRHISSRLAAHIDGQLAPPEVGKVESHLEHCPRCRIEREEILAGMSMIGQLTPAHAPDSLWTSIESEISQIHATPAPWHRRSPWRFAIAALLLSVAGLAFWQIRHRQETRWEVTRIDAKQATRIQRMSPRDWIETGASSRARIIVGAIGVVEVGPNTRIGRLAARSGEHRLTLARGDISAKILAPPRLFFVDTPSGTAVDLGCEYTLHAGDDGTGLLNVTRGWVSYEWQGRESLVPAGASCRTRAGIGPGTPYFDDATPAFMEALASFDFANGASGALPAILTESRVRDTLTLWHLLSRVAPADRSLVFDRMVVLSRLPAGITRERILALDPGDLNRWKEELAWTW